MKMNKPKLTVEMLKAMKPWEMFDKWFTRIKHPRFNQATKTVDEEWYTTVKYVAIRWKWMHDRACYHSLDANFEHADYLDWDSHLTVPFQEVADMWSKMRPEDAFELFTIEDDEVKDLYRY